MMLENKSLKSTFIRFLIPSVVAQWTATLLTMVDGFFVAQGVSETALSAVNISMPFLYLLYAVSLALAVGSSTLIAVKMRQGRQGDADRIYTQTLVVSVGISAVIAVAVLLNLETVCRFLGATDLTIGYVKEYVGVLAAFGICPMLSYTFEILIKTDGAPRYASIGVALTAMLNILLDWLMVIVFQWGVLGAALATGLSQLAGITLYLWYFLSERATLKFCRFRLDGKLIGRTFFVGLPSGITELSAGVGTFLFNQAILRFLGQDALVSYSVIAYVSNIVIMSMAGIVQGFQPLVSFYQGKNEPSTVRKLLKYGMVSAAVISAAALFFSLAAADGVVSLFISPELEELRVYSARALRVFSVSFLLVGFNVVAGGYFTALERTKSAFTITLGRGMITLAAALLGTTALLGGAGIWWAPAVSEALCLVMTVTLLLLYERKRAV